MIEKVYVAASSDELDRAEAAMELLREAGFEVALNWVKTIRECGIANPEEQERDGDCRVWAEASRGAVRGADAFWLLAPSVGAARGAFTELGIGIEREIPIVVSGPHARCSIFARLANELVPEDVRALAILSRWRNVAQQKALDTRPAQW